jgi:SEC-C motif-containing protein
MSLCACGSGRELKDCCEPLLNGGDAQTAEALMRARYTAHVLGKLDYVEQTCGPEAKAGFNRQDTARSLKDIVWQGLEISRTEKGGKDDDTGVVDFAFRYRFQGQDCVQREIASFERVDGKWTYMDSQIDPKGDPVRVEHVGRNEPCPCGSGKKYKKCCGG